VDGPHRLGVPHARDRRRSDQGAGSGDSYGDWAAVRALEDQLPGATGGRAVMAGGTVGDPGGRPRACPPARRERPDEAVAGVGKGNPMFEGEQAVALVKGATGMTLGGLRRPSSPSSPCAGTSRSWLVSEGFLLLPRMPGYADVIDLARRANVAVHFIDPRGLETGFAAAALPTGIGPPDPT